MSELTEAELESVVHRAVFHGMTVVISDDVNAIRCTNVLPPSITARGIECMYLDFSALSLTDKIDFKKHTRAVQESTAKVFLSDFNKRGVFELIFDDKHRAAAFMNAFFHFASLNKRIVPKWTGSKTISIKYRTKQDRLHVVGGRVTK